MVISLYRSHLRVQEDLVHHNNVDKNANRIVFNLAGAAMQFSRLIRSSFRG